MNKRMTTALTLDRAAPDAVKAADDKPDGYIAGWASTPGMDHYRHIVVPGAFDASIKERGLGGPRGVKLLAGHDWNRIAGRIEVLETRGDGLWLEAQMELGISYANDLYKAASFNGGLNFSVGFDLQDYCFKEDDDGTEYLRIDRGDLFEVSVVAFPANEECTMAVVKSLFDARDAVPSSIGDFERRLVELGHVPSRNAAQRIVREIKACPDVFRALLDAQAADGDPQRPGDAAIDPSLIEKLRAIRADLTARPGDA